MSNEIRKIKTSRVERVLGHSKSFAQRIVRRMPSNSEGSDGDIALGHTPSGIKLFAKIGNKWHSFSADKETIPIYTISNLAINKELNANGTLPNLNDIVGTLLKDLAKLGLIRINEK